ncbi:MAG: T3SS effector HopA1 family protein [Patescibacteria group bacterium]|jgi:hypothetical protein
MPEKGQPPIRERESERITLSLTPREFTIGDTVDMQDYMRMLRESQPKCVPEHNSLYEHIISGKERKRSKDEKELLADAHCFDGSISTLLSTWVRTYKIRGEPPKTLEVARQLFAVQPELNQQSPVHFQGGIEEPTPGGDFIHMKTGWAIKKPIEPIAWRYYLNPAANKVGRVVNILLNEALRTETPLYFKFVDVATPGQWPPQVTRSDRIIIYSSEEQTRYIEQLLEHIVNQEREAFAGREITGFSARLADGVSKSEEVSEEQNNAFRGYWEGISFNHLRAKLILETTMSITRNFITSPYYSSFKIRGKTPREKFYLEAGEYIREHLNNASYRESVGDMRSRMEQAMSLGLSSKKLEAGGYSKDTIHYLEAIVANTARDILPFITPDSLLPHYHSELKQIAPKYGIDPRNLAVNIPIEH